MFLKLEIDSYLQSLTNDHQPEIEKNMLELIDLVNDILDRKPLLNPRFLQSEFLDSLVTPDAEQNMHALINYCRHIIYASKTDNLSPKQHPFDKNTLTSLQEHKLFRRIDTLKILWRNYNEAEKNLIYAILSKFNARNDPNGEKRKLYQQTWTDIKNVRSQFLENITRKNLNHE